MADLGSLFGAVGNIISSAINAKTQKKLVRETNDTNKQIADAANQTALQNTIMTNDTNIEIADKNNAAARELADLEYERNSIAGKFQQYIDAGFSEMQAKQLAAGATAGEYSAPALQQATAVAPPAPAVPTMQTPNVTPPDVSGLSGLGSLVSDFTAPDGGTLGALSGREVTAEIYKHMSEFPEGIFTTQDFAKWMQSQPENHWTRNPDFVDSFNNMFKYLPGQRYFNSFLSQQYQFRDKKQQIERNAKEIKMIATREQLTASQIDGSKLDNTLKQLDFDVQSAIKDSTIEIYKANARSATSSADYAERTLDARVNRSVLENRNIEAGISQIYAETELASVQSDIASVQLGNMEYVSPFQNEAAVAELKLQCIQATKEESLWHSKEYADNWRKMMLSDVENRVIINGIDKMVNSNTFKQLQRDNLLTDEQKETLGFYHCLARLGILVPTETENLSFNPNTPISVKTSPLGLGK